MKKYKLINVETGKKVEWTLKQILDNINRDRNQDWIDYDETDWKEGLEVFTEYRIERKKVKTNEIQERRQSKNPQRFDCK